MATIYAKRFSNVEVTFIDGQVKTYLISAAPSVSTHLARQAGETGVLTLFNDETSVGIPMGQIREYSISPTEAPVAEGEAQ